MDEWDKDGTWKRIQAELDRRDRNLLALIILAALLVAVAIGWGVAQEWREVRKAQAIPWEWHTVSGVDRQSAFQTTLWLDENREVVTARAPYEWRAGQVVCIKLDMPYEESGVRLREVVLLDDSGRMCVSR